MPFIPFTMHVFTADAIALGASVHYSIPAAKECLHMAEWARDITHSTAEQCPSTTITFSATSFLQCRLASWS
jgi:hypothetical protein